MAAQEYQAPESVGRLQQRALVIGGVALLVSILGAVRTPGLFYQSYLMSFLLILGLTVGSLGLVMLQHLVSGIGASSFAVRWNRPLARFR